MTLNLLSRAVITESTALTPLQSQVEGLVGGFAEQASDWRSLVAMMAGGMAYRAGRIGVMGLGGGSLLRSASVGVGLTAEVSTFEFAHRGLSSLTVAQGHGPLHANLWSWNGPGGIRQGLLQSFITFGALKGAGRLTQGQNFIAQHLFQDTAMVLGHQVGGALGIAPWPTATLAEQFLYAEATNLQIGAGMSLAGRMAPGIHALERGLDLSLSQRFNFLGPLRGDEGLARAAAGAGNGRGLEREGEEKGPTRLFMVGDGNGNGNGRDGVVPKIIRQVLDRGQRTELQSLSQILHAFLSEKTQTTYRLWTERLATKDPEEWRLALRSMVHDARMHESLEEDAAFQEFARDWLGRPHYKDLLEIQVQFDPSLTHTQTLRSDMRILQHGLVPDPSIDGFLKFLLNNQVSPHPTEEGMYHQKNVRRGGAPIALRRTQYNDGSTDFVGNWKRAGIRITFDPRGYLRLPIYAKKAYPLDQIPKEAPRVAGTAPAPGRGSDSAASRPLRPLPGNLLAPQRDDTPSLWAMRLIEIVQKGDQDTALQVAAYLHELLVQPTTKKWVEETMDRLTALTAGTSEGDGILVRRLPAPGLAEPLRLLSLPTTFLPETWSKTFLDGMAKELDRNPRNIGRLIEIGSGTGYVSIALAKMAQVDQILALDKNSHAPIVGAFNAALNGVHNIEFRQSDTLDNVRSVESADLIVGCLPQAPSGKSSLALSLRELADYGQDSGSRQFEDVFGLGTLARTIEVSRSYLKDHNSRLWLMVADRVGAPLMEDLFVRRGMHPRLLHFAQIRQAAGTDLTPMAKVEEKTGFNFVFHSPEGESLSAREAVRRSGELIGHGLHLVEARPYRSLFKAALAGHSLNETDFLYTAEAGSERPGLQKALAQNLSRQWGLDISPETVFIGPNREALAEGILRLSLSQDGRWGWVGEPPGKNYSESLFGFSSPQSFEGLRDALLGIQKNPHDVLFLNLPRQMGDPILLRELLLLAASHGTRLVFLEDHPALSNSEGRGLSQVLGEIPQAQGSWILLQSLGDRFHMPEMALASAVIPEGELRKGLARYADVNYSRASSVLQSLYETFLERLNQDAFLTDLARPFFSVTSVEGTGPRPTQGVKALDLPQVYEAEPKAAHPDPIDLSFGESAFRPSFLKPSLLDFQIHPPHREFLGPDAREAASRYLRQARRADFSPDEIVLGAGVQPLLLSSLRALKHLHADKTLEVLVPEPSYGIYFPTVASAGPGIELKVLPTSEAGRFLVSPRQLIDFRKNKGIERALLINTPSNPAGQYYTAEALAELSQAAHRRGIFILMDEVFHGLHFERPAPSLAPSPRGNGSDAMVLFGGLSKEFALPGLRFGFAASRHPEFLRALERFLTVPPDFLALRSAAEYLPNWENFLKPHREYLAERAGRMEAFFRERGFQVLPPQGGYSLFVNLNPILGGDRSFRGEILTPENFPELLMAHGGVKVKSDRWAGVPGHYRFVYSVERLGEALRRLEKFFNQVR